LDIDITEEFGELLEEASKSLKRTLTFVGGVVRGYLRRGHKNEKWVKMIRKIESRYVADDMAKDSELIGSDQAQAAESSSLKVPK
jgi:hypothetical protein